MFNAFKRLLRVSTAEAHSAIDRMEDPVKMSEQAIRELREDQRKAMEALAEVKAILIRTKREEKEAEQAAADYENKAMMLLKRGQQGELDADEADRLATEALSRKEEQAASAAQARGEREKYEGMTANLEAKVKDIRQQITQWENELKTLKARSRVSSATKKLNKQMANADSRSTISTLERMRDKVAEEEALAESYGEIAAKPSSVDDEIDAALGSQSKQSESLSALKARMGISSADKSQ